MIRYCGLLGLILMLLLSSCTDKGTYVFGVDQLIMVGDSMHWSSVDYDDSHWSQWLDDIPTDSVFWVRNSEVFPKLDTHKELGVRITATGSYELYWDGVYLGNNGTLGIGNQKEVPGKYINQVLLPDSLAQSGKHVMALRCTKAYPDIGQHAFFYADDYKEILTGGIQMSKYMFFIGGIFFMTGLYFFFLFLGNKNDFSFLIFSVICFVFLGLLMLEYYKLFYFYDYPFQLKRIQIIGYLHVALSFLIPSFFALELKFPWKKHLWILIAIGVIIIEYMFDGRQDYAAVLENRMMWTFSLIVVLYACYQQMKEAFVVLFGFIGSYLVFFFTPYLEVNYVSDYDIAIFASFIFIILSMLYIISYQRKEQRRAYEESLVVSERLKNELLKKNIKPHFIMNTLTSLIDWVEDSPKEGVKFIHALADEFDVLNEIADHKLVPIDQEIKLCENHLKVMGFRKEIKYKWIQNGIDKNEIIPPAILHTAVENGVTHSRPNENGEIVFVLDYSKINNKRVYSLLVKAKIDDKILNDESKNITIGTGTKYIKSRLQESYGKDWEYESHSTPDGWLTTITILSK